MRYYLLLIIATMLMASAFVAGKVLIVAGADPIALVASRFIAAGLIALIWLKVLGKLQMPNSWQGLQGIVIVGSLQSAALFAICFSALDYLSAAVVSLITMTMPLWVVGIGAALDRKMPARAQLAGLFLGVLGVAMVVGGGFSSREADQPLWAAFVILGAIAWALATLYTKRVNFGVSGWSLNGWQMLIGGCEVLLLQLLLARPALAVASLSEWLALSWLVVPASIVSFGLWFAALRLGGAGVTSGYLFLVPLFTALLSIPILGASFSTYQMFGGAMIGCGIWLMSKS